MWPLNLLKKRHWIVLALCFLFLASYGGFVSWAKVALALEKLADQPSVRQRFATPIGRGEAIVTSFMFFLLTPLARFSDRVLFRIFDRALIDGSVNGTGVFASVSGDVVRQSQTGQIRHYALFMFLAAIFIMTFYLIYRSHSVL